jgi:drug/metabolite transporter (DMT)-like permease
MRRLHAEKLTALFCLVLAISCFGVVPVFLRILSRHADQWTVNGLRYSFAAVFWFPWVLALLGRHREELRAEGHCVWRDALPVAVVNLGGQIGWGAAPYYLDASTIGFVIRLSFLFALLFGFLLIREERSLARRPRFWLGALLCVAGTTALFLPGLAAERAERGKFLTGMAILLGSSACWGLYVVLVRRRLARYPVRLAFGVIALYTSAALLVLMLLFGDVTTVAQLDARLWAYLVVSALLGVAFGHVLNYRAIHGLGPVVTSGVTMTQPLVTFALAAWCLGETMAPTALAGGFCVITGGVLLVVAKARTAQ